MSEQSFGEYIRYLRELKGLGVTELARLSNVSSSYISQVENEKRSVPQPHILQKLAPHLGVGRYELMVKAGYFEPAREPLLIDDELTKTLFLTLTQSRKELLKTIQGLDEEQIFSICDMLKRVLKQEEEADE